MSEVRMYARDGDKETDITEGVQALYDLVIGGMDWGSGFLTTEDAVPVAMLARVCGFERAEEAERYLLAQQQSDAQQEFLRKHDDARGWGFHPPPHDHVFGPAGKCLWPNCSAKGEPEPAVDSVIPGVVVAPGERIGT